MYHALLLEGVLDLLNVARASPRAAPAGWVETLAETAARMLGALEVWTHPDGEIALFGDAAFGIAQPCDALRRYAEGLGISPARPTRSGVLDRAGFVRLANGGLSLLVSVAGPMPSYQPGHAHCDALAFELCVGRERVVCDTGVSEYVPGALRDAARATRSHATLEVDGREQAEWWAAHRVGGRPAVRLESVEPGRRVEATCASWSTPDTVHRRRIELVPGELRIEDRLEGRTRRARAFLPLAPDREPRLDGSVARLRLRDGGGLRIDLPDAARWRVADAPYFPEFGRSLERRVLIGESEHWQDARWRFRRED
jgi:hypothetical protein